MSANGIRRATMSLLIGWAALAYSVAPAAAQGYAVRGGANVNPDQIYVGGQYELGPFHDRVWFQPNADVGFGDDATLVSLNFARDGFIAARQD